MPLRIWSNAAMPEPAMRALRAGISPNALVQDDNARKSVLEAGASSDVCRSSDVAFGQPDPSDIIASESIRWVHLTSAGYTRYDTPEFRSALARRNIITTNSSGVYDEPCAQHLLAMMLGLARQMPWSAVDQPDHKWEQLPIRAKSRLLLGESVLILTLGSIGRRLVELLQPFHMKITAVRRQPRGDESVPTIALARVDEILPTIDHVVNILPAADNTRGFFDAARIARIKPGAIFYNIGRGDTVDQTALHDALTSGHVSAAYLDVTTPEPLPPGEPLWSAPNCHITPHVAGGHGTEFDRHVEYFIANLARFNDGRPLQGRVLAE